jgi:SAM-dependent methyltransferase
MVAPGSPPARGVHPLSLTGERTVPLVGRENYWFRRHEAAYRWIAAHHGPALAGASVVEAGSGEGYGAQLLREAGARVVAALEYDSESVLHTAHTYPGVAAVEANLAALPLLPGATDVVVSLQVVEHLWDLRGFLRGTRRALRPGGILVVTTPNRPTFSPGLGRGERPTNPFHVEEFDAEQLAGLVVAAGFDDVVVRGVAHGPRLAAEDAAQGPIVEALVRAVLQDAWDEALDDRVDSVTTADFVVVDEAPTSLDLVLTARAITGGRP